MIWRALHEYVNVVHGPEKPYRSLLPRTGLIYVRCAAARHVAYLAGTPIQEELRNQQLCNADRRCDSTSLHVRMDLISRMALI